MKKLLALSEQSKPRQKAHPSLEREAGTGGAGAGGGVQEAPRRPGGSQEAPRRPGGSQVGGQPRSEAGSVKVDRADQPTPVNLTSESSSVTGRPKEAAKVKVRKMQNSIGSVTSTDSGYGQGFERLERQHSESPQLPPRRRYQHYHRHQPHGNLVSPTTRTA